MCGLAAIAQEASRRSRARMGRVAIRPSGGAPLLLCLQLVPELVEVGERSRVHCHSSLASEPFEPLETPLELLIRPVQRERGVYTGAAAEIHDREEQIAEFVFQCRAPVATIVARELRAHFAELLLDLQRGSLCVAPVEAHTRGAILQPMRPMQRGQTGRQPVSNRAPPPGLHGFPVLPIAAAIQVRMPLTHLLNERAGHVVRVELPILLGDHRVKQHLEQQVAQLLAQVRDVSRSQRVIELVGLFHEVRAQRLVRLRAVPVAAGSEIAHEGERIFKCRLMLHGSSVARYTTRPCDDTSMQSALMRAWVEIDLDALRRNGAAMAARCAALLPMVKADAYGLGAVAVARALTPLAPWGYGVATVGEGLELRNAGLSHRIIVFTPVLTAQLADLRAARLTPVLSSADDIRAWHALGGGPWHLTIDTGMSRAGVRWTSVASLADLVREDMPEGAYTHFHSAELDDASRAGQESRFDQAVAALPVRPSVLHAENSAALARVRRSRYDLGRPGVFLYGVGSGRGALVTPEQVAHVRARVVAVRDVCAGDSVSYDATWRATSRRRIATLAIGYADGYRRSLGNRGTALVGGRRAPVAGVVTMDMTMLDVTDVPCRVGDIATLLGRDGDDVLTPEEVATAAGVSPYELLTGLRGRLEHVVLSGTTP